MASVEESVSTNKRKGDGQRELQEEANKRKKISIASYIGVAKIFDWGGGPNHKSHAMTSSKIFKTGTFGWAKIS